jgi:hypothetical protein
MYVCVCVCDVWSLCAGLCVCLTSLPPTPPSFHCHGVIFCSISHSLSCPIHHSLFTTLQLLFIPTHLPTQICCEMHPKMSLIATSGIESVVRLWTPALIEGNPNLSRLHVADEVMQHHPHADGLRRGLPFRILSLMQEEAEEGAGGPTLQCVHQ